MQRGTAIHDALDAFLAATAAALAARRGADLRPRDRRGPGARPRRGPRCARSGPRGSRARRRWFLATEVQRRAPRGAVRARGQGRAAARRRAACRSASPPRPTASTGDAAGGYAIYDYKSGDVPSAPEAAAFHLQLPLEAAIAEAGGFEDLPPGRATHLELIGVGARKTLALDPDPSRDSGTASRRLIAAYQDPAQGFVARLRPQQLSLRQRLRPPLAVRRMGRRRRPRARRTWRERRAGRADRGGPAEGVELGRRQRRLGQDPGADRPGGAAAARPEPSRRRSCASPTPRPPRPRCRPGSSAPSGPGR